MQLFLIAAFHPGLFEVLVGESGEQVDHKHQDDECQCRAGEKGVITEFFRAVHEGEQDGDVVKIGAVADFSHPQQRCLLHPFEAALLNHPKGRDDTGDADREQEIEIDDVRLAATEYFPECLRVLVG